MTEGGFENNPPPDNNPNREQFLDKYNTHFLVLLSYTTAELITSIYQDRWFGAARSVIEFFQE